MLWLTLIIATLALSYVYFTMKRYKQILDFIIGGAEELESTAAGLESELEEENESNSLQGRDQSQQGAHPGTEEQHRRREQGSADPSDSKAGQETGSGQTGLKGIAVGAWGTFEWFVLVLGLMTLAAKAFTTWDINRARQRRAEADTESKRIKGLIKQVNTERQPLITQIFMLDRELEQTEIESLEMQIGQITTRNDEIRSEMNE